MKYTKRLVVAVFLFFSSQFIFSQDISQATDAVKKVAKIGTDRWRNTLVLTNKQADKLLAITTAYEMKKREIYHSKDATPEELNTKLLALEKTHHQSVEAILSEKQIEKFRAKIIPIKG